MHTARSCGFNPSARRGKKKLKTKRTTLSILILLLIIPALSAAAEASWSTAVDHFSRSKDLNPYSMEVLSKTYNGKGEIEKTENMLFSLSYDEKGETESELIMATEDGKDITEKKKKEDRNHSGGGPPGNNEGFQKNPFDPAVQNDVTATDTGAIEYRSGQRCAVWDFRLKLNKDHDAVGKAWISLQTGAAVNLKYRLDPNFPFVEDMSITLNYITDSSGRWLMDKMQFTGRVNMIIMKKSFDAITSFSDYR